MSQRPAIFGRQGWYPQDPERCAEALQAFSGRNPDEQPAHHAGILPHAGWFFSGDLATWTVAALCCGEPRPDLVWVFGGHLLPGDSAVCMAEGSWATPFGPLPVQEELAQAFCAEFPCVAESPERFQPDNTTELQMPMLKYFWPDTRVIAIGVPPDDMAEKIGEWAARRSKEAGLKSLALGSTDLTHYGANYGFVPKGTGAEALRWAREENDAPFIQLMLRMQGAEALAHARSHQSACCPGAAVAALAFARAQGAESGRLIAQTTSHDKEPGREPLMWVGYASIVF